MITDSHERKGKTDLQAKQKVGHFFSSWLSLILSLIIWSLLYSQLNRLTNWFVFSLLHLEKDSSLGSSLAFFIYEAPKVLLLLSLIVFLVGIIRSFVTPEQTRRFLAGKSEVVGTILAACLGIITPFCSCSAVPLFIGFIAAGVPLGVTLSFLVAAPMINEVALVLLFGLFGWEVTILYVATGLFIAIFSGLIMGHLRMERFVEAWVYRSRLGEIASRRMGWEERIRFSWTSTREIVGKVWPFVLLGIAVGAGIHGYVPENFMASIMGREVWWSVPLAVLIGVPLYSNAAGMIPLVQALLSKGAALGTALAFMMAVIGLSLPETIILRRVLRLRLLIIFLSVVSAGIILVGYLFNLVI